MAKTLEPSLHGALAGYRAAYEIGSDINPALKSIIAKLGNQSPTTIASADGEIANVAGLNWWQPERSLFQRVLRPRTSESELLLRTPGLEYLYMFHRNGRLREQALNRIHGPLPNSFLVAAIAWRLNDWASQVRASAMDCARRCFERTKPNILARFFLFTLRQQTSWGRWAQSEQEFIIQHLRRNDVTTELAKLLQSERNGPLPSTLAYVIRYPEIDGHLELLARDAVHPGIRAIALRALIDAEASFANGMQWRWIDKSMGLRRKEPRIERRALTVSSDRRSLYLQGVKDKSAIVRRSALSGIIKHDLHQVECQKLAHEHTADPSPSVRARAEFIVSRNLDATLPDGRNLSAHCPLIQS